MCPYAASRSKSNFYLPDDYLPERWLEGSSTEGFKYYNDERAVVQPFSVGPRSCIGKTLANAELRVILAKLLWNSDISLPDGLDSGLDWDKQKTWSFWKKPELQGRLVPSFKAAQKKYF